MFQDLPKAIGYDKQMPYILVTPVQSIIHTIPTMTTRFIMNNSVIILLKLVLVTIWVFGAVSVIVYHAMRHRHFLKIVRRWSAPVSDPNELEIFDRLKSELGIKTQIGLSECQSITIPMLVGYFRPAILLPPNKITDAELSLILKHELIHFRQHDLWFKALILTATAFYWFNPVIFLLAKAVAIQCEISCDALVLKDADFQQRKQYGETIIGVVRNGTTLRTALSTNLYGGKKGMKYRIASIVDTKRKKTGVIVFCMALVGIIVTGAALAAATNPNKQEESITTTLIPEVVAAAPNNDGDNENPVANEVTSLLDLLRHPYSNSSNIKDPQEIIASTWAPEVTAEAPKSDSNNDNPVTDLLELLQP